jgi:hypothetical protein
VFLQIHFHGQDWASLQKFITPEVLPQEYGGLKPQADFTKALQYLYDNEEKLMGNVDAKFNTILWYLICDISHITFYYHNHFTNQNILK